MIRYVLKRIVMLIPVVLCVAIVIFTIMFFCPGDPADIILGSSAKDSEIAALRAQLGLDQPYIVQLGRFLYDTFIRFDLGESWINGRSVAQELMTRFPRTMVFALSSIVIQVVVGIPLGVAAATHQNKLGDHLCMIFALVGVSIPAFWLALMLMQLFGVKLGWLPVYGVQDWTGWILPVFCGSIGVLAQMARQARSSMLDVIRSDYMTTAQAKGIPKRRRLYRYALPNGMIPLIQTLGNAFGTSLGGTLIIETVFSIAGIGTYIQTGISTRDYPIVRGSVVVLSIAFSLVMLLVDLAFAFVDPRIKAQYAGKRKRRRKRRRANAKLLAEGGDSGEC